MEGWKQLTRPSHCSIQFTQLSRGLFSNQAVIPHHLSHNGSILLFHKTLIRFEVGASSREGNLLGFTIAQQGLIDELPAIIHIQTQDRKRKERSRLLESGEDRLRAFIENGKTFRPSRRHIGEGQGRHIASLRVLPTMGHQICFQKTGPGGIPLLERANGDLLFEQRSGLGGAKPTRSRYPVGVQDAIGGGRAH